MSNSNKINWKVQIMLYFLLFFEGFVGLAFQMLFIRQLTPEIGASAVTSSWIIGIFLLALAGGYKRGGIPSDDPLRKLAKNFCFTALIGGVGASSIAIAFHFAVLRASMGTISSLILYCMFFVAPVAFWMGQSLPLLIQRSKWGNNVSELSGNALYLSTIGSFAGSIITTNVFYTFIGATNTLILISIITLFVGGYMLKSKGRLFAAATILLVLIMGSGRELIHKNSISRSTAYLDVDVKNITPNRRVLIANKGAMSIIDKNGKNKAWYLKEYSKMLNKYRIIEQNVLVLGAGGFLAHTVDYNMNKYTYIDIEPKAKEIAEEDFLRKKIDVDFIAMDARRYLIDTDKKYGTMLLDVFSSNLAIPSHVVTKEFFELISTKLTDDGYLIINAILDPKFRDDYSKHFHLTVTSVFPFCNYRLNTATEKSANMLYVCHKTASASTIYTDDNNDQEFDFWSRVEDIL